MYEIGMVLIVVGVVGIGGCAIWWLRSIRRSTRR